MDPSSSLCARVVRSTIPALVAAVWGTAFACGAASSSSGFDTGASGGVGASSGGGGGVATGASGLNGASSTGGSTGAGLAGNGFSQGDGGAAQVATCASESRTGQVFPVDIFIMMDQSGSMNDTVTGPNGASGTKWSFLKQAFTAFVQNPNSDGLGIGIQYFPIPNVDNSSCDAGTYAVTNDPAAPASGQGVPIAPLPGNSAPIVASLNAHTPGGQTPTVPALAGALAYAQSWATKNPTHKVVVVFATDGTPHGCTNNTVTAAAAIAQSYATATPSIPTYVIGIGSSLSSLNQIAQGGGTKAALIVNTTLDTAGQFLADMNMIRSAAVVPCVLTIPRSDGGAVDFSKVNVVDTPADGGAPVNLLQVPVTAMCDPTSGGWFYDNAAAPASIHLCPASCDKVTQDMTDQVDILLGCKTLVAPPR